jgi:hypothetical protein
MYKKNYWGALKNWKDLYDSHLELEIIELQLKLFNLELKDNDPMDLAYEIKSIMHDIDVASVEI